MSRRLHAIPAMLAACAALRAASPADYLPPAPAWHGASEKLVVPSGHPWITPAEQTGLTDSPDYETTIAWLAKLCDASPWLELRPFGVSAQGRTLYVVVATKDPLPEGSWAPRSAKPLLLAQAGIHAGEIDGKDAGLMFLRDLAFGGKDGLLDRANFVFVPVFNPDGHERASEWNRPNQRGPVRQGWRTTAQNLNLNRDYMKADAPEMMLMLRLLGDTKPALYLDLHVTDGIDYQYDITYGFHGWDGTPAWSAQSAAWLDRIYRPAVDRALRAAGHIPGGLVFAANNRDLTDGLFRGNADPRFSNAYGDLRGIPAVLVENHSLKPYRQRVLGTCVLLEASLRALGDHADAVRQAMQADAAARPATLPVNWQPDPAAATKVDFHGIAHEDYVSPASGVKEVRWLGTPELIKDLPVHWATKPGAMLRRPKAYWVPVTKPEVIQRLRNHGIEMEIIGANRTIELEHYRLVDPKPAAEPFEGRHLVRTGVRAERHAATFPRGSVRVPTDQPLGNLAMALLEPACNDSLLAWGFFPEILQRTEYIEGYVVAPMAEAMLAADPQLKAEFEAKLAADEKFRGDADARLEWFYARSRFHDAQWRLYPVGIER